MSPRERRYKLPPIVEAGLTLSLEDSQAASVEFLAARFDELFPGWEADNILDVGGTLVPLAASTSDPIPADHSVVGFQRRRESERFRLVHDEVRYVRAYRGATYTEWEDFIAGAMVFFIPLVSVPTQTRVTSVEVRFVNELPIPIADGGYEIGDYVRMFVDVPGKLPQTVNQMFAQVDIPFERDNEVIDSKTTIFAGYRGEKPVLVLDLGVSRDIVPSSVNDLEDTLELLRSVKNELFEGAITDACRIQMRGASK